MAHAPATARRSLRQGRRTGCRRHRRRWLLRLGRKRSAPARVRSRVRAPPDGRPPKVTPPQPAAPQARANEGPAAGQRPSGALARGGPSRQDAVASRALRLVELFVGALDEVQTRAVAVVKHRGADRNGHANGLPLDDETALFDLLAQTFGQRPRSFEIGLGQNNRELLAAVTREYLVTTDSLL